YVAKAGERFSLWLVRQLMRGNKIGNVVHVDCHRQWRAVAGRSSVQDHTRQHRVGMPENDLATDWSVTQRIGNEASFQDYGFEIDRHHQMIDPINEQRTGFRTHSVRNSGGGRVAEAKGFNLAQDKFFGFVAERPVETLFARVSGAVASGPGGVRRVGPG